MKAILDDYEIHKQIMAKIGQEPLSLKDYAQAWPWIKE